MNPLAAFFPGMRLRCGAVEGRFEEIDGFMRIVGNSGKVYDTLDAFFMEECGRQGIAEDPWDACEFWKSWCWWKCKEMLPPIS